MNARRLLVQQVRLEQLAFWRNPDQAFFTFALPLVLLVVLGLVNSGDEIPGRDLDASTLFVPGILALGVITSAYANLAARISVLRAEGVLKRIRATPLDPSVYLGGHLASTLLTTLAIAATTVLLGRVMLGAEIRPGGVPALLAGLVLGIVCFGALGLAVSAIISNADAAGPVTIATYLPLALMSGVFDPSLELPSWLRRVVEAFPVEALVTALRTGYDPAAAGVPAGDAAVLAAWSVAGVALALRYFRWQR